MLVLKGQSLLQVFDPATLKTLGQVPDCDVHDLERAIEAAQQAFQVWSSFTAEVSNF